jgi:hypothetical protein
MMQRFSKALAGALSASGAALITAATDNGVASNEWWIILGSFLVGGAVVYKAPANE